MSGGDGASPHACGEAASPTGRKADDARRPFVVFVVFVLKEGLSAPPIPQATAPGGAARNQPERAPSALPMRFSGTRAPDLVTPSNGSISS